MSRKSTSKSIRHWLKSVSDAPENNTSREFSDTEQGREQQHIREAQGDKEKHQQPYCNTFAPPSPSSKHPLTTKNLRLKTKCTANACRREEFENSDIIPPKRTTARKLTTKLPGTQSAAGKRKRAAPETITAGSVDEQDDNPSVTRTSTTSGIPVRGQLFRLKYAKPRVVCEQFGSQCEPQNITDLFHGVVKSKDSPMPSSFRAILPGRYPNQPPAREWVQAEETIIPQPTTQENAKFEAIAEVFDGATLAHSLLSDENGWSPSTRRMLVAVTEMATGEAEKRNNMIRVVEAQSIGIGPSELLPRMDHSIPSKKIDFILSYSPEHSRVREVVDAVQLRHNLIFLSPTEEIQPALQPQLAAIELKTPEGGYLSSSLQLATWLTAGLEKVKQLNVQAGLSLGEDRTEQTTPPLMGVTVVGHIWLLYIASKAANGDVTLYGPISMGDTLSFRGTFEVFNSLSFVVSWGQDIYWPWLEANILTPLAQGGEESGDDNVEE